MIIISYVVTSLFGAFLLFQIQPMVGKSLLPWFGGAPLVWTTCMMFFQALLLGGYAYAHLVINRLPRRRQPFVHLVVLAAGIAFGRVLPAPVWAPTGVEQPALHLLLILAANVAVPFFALSATQPLLQSWFHGIYPNRSPYPLYAVSNTGSLLAVMTYPFLFEPLLPLPRQETLWFVAFLAFCGGCALCGIGFWRYRKRTSSAPPAAVVPAGSPPEAGGRLWAWLGFSACGSALLLTTTDQASQDIAATPLFWVMPLGLYLVSFIICFARDSFYRRGFWLKALPAAVLLLAAERLTDGAPTFDLVVYGVTLFIGCMVCHGELARLRPDAGQLTRFYFALSVGGAAGGLFTALIAPLIFPGLWEFALCWVALCSLVLLLSYREGQLAIPTREARLRLAAHSLAWVVAAGILTSDVVVDRRGTEQTFRNFFGRLAVTRNPRKRCLYHGMIQHGCQWRDPALAMEPTTYYGPDSGVGVGTRALRRIRPGAPLRMGVVGLGIGTSAAWGEAGDTVRFYELDPAVVTVAKDRFSYLENAEAKVRIVIGDARISLEREVAAGDAPLDLLVLDAFSGDAIPIHLLTREAFDTYWRRLSPGGILAIHISNQHFNLEPLVLGLSRGAGKAALHLETEEDAARLTYASTWVIVTGNPEAVGAVRALGYDRPWPREHAEPIVFTDQFSNLLSLL